MCLCVCRGLVGARCSGLVFSGGLKTTFMPRRLASMSEVVSGQSKSPRSSPIQSSDTTVNCSAHLLSKRKASDQVGFACRRAVIEVVRRGTLLTLKACVSSCRLTCFSQEKYSVQNDVKVLVKCSLSCTRGTTSSVS